MMDDFIDAVREMNIEILSKNILFVANEQLHYDLHSAAPGSRSMAILLHE